MVDGTPEDRLLLRQARSRSVPVQQTLGFRQSPRPPLKFLRKYCSRPRNGTVGPTIRPKRQRQPSEMDFPHRFRSRADITSTRATFVRARPRTHTFTATLSVECVLPGRRRLPSVSSMDPWGSTASAGSSPRAFQGGWTAHAAPSGNLAANATPCHGCQTNPKSIIGLEGTNLEAATPTQCHG